MKKIYLMILTTLACCLLLVTSVFATNYYVSVNGDDVNNGTTATTPFLTLAHAISLASSGDTIFVASGTYVTPATIAISATKSGIAIKGIFNSPSERPLLDFSEMIVASSNYGISLKASNCYIYGIRIKGAGDNGLIIDGSHDNHIEFCDFFENRDSGLQLSNGALQNKIINCDSYYNADPGQGNADGFANKLEEGGLNVFHGCRAYQNSDDGWDGLIKTQMYMPLDSIIDCWCYKNGYLKNGTASVGNGNGFKLGGNSLIHRQVVINCFSVQNRAKGFDYNNNVGSMTLYNCTGQGNGGIGNFAFPNPLASGETLILKNCLSYDASYGTIHTSAVQATNSWMSSFTVSPSDFLSTDATQMLLPRKPDGSLPDITFMHLAPGSDLIDGGTNVGIPYNRSAPDLGCFETGSSTNSMLKVSITSPTDKDVFTAPASITINASAIESNGTISKVEFYNGNTLLGTDNTAPYSYSWTGVAIGSYKISAKVTNMANLSAASDTVQITVVDNQPSVVKITSPGNNSVYSTSTINISIYATDPDGTISKVEYYDGTTLIGTVTVSPYNLVWNNPGPGSHTLSAKVTDSKGGVTTSGTVTLINNVAAILPSTSYKEFTYIYPNPFNETFIIKCNEEIAHLWVINSLGEPVRELNNVIAGEKLALGKELQEGIYVLIIELRSGQREVAKLIKKK